MKALICEFVLAVMVITDITSAGHDQGSLSSRKLTRDGTSLKHGAIRVKEGRVNENSLFRRDGTPPKSPSSPILEETLLRALMVWRVLHDKGCPQKEENIFNITVYTANMALAQTTSWVYINLYGKIYGWEESTEKIRLTNNDRNEFQRGGVGSFLVKAKFVGLVTRVTIEHDNTGPLPDWNLQKVVVQDLKLGTVQTFMCNCEMAGYENQVTLPPI